MRAIRKDFNSKEHMARIECPVILDKVKLRALLGNSRISGWCPVTDNSCRNFTSINHERLYFHDVATICSNILCRMEEIKRYKAKEILNFITVYYDIKNSKFCASYISEGSLKVIMQEIIDIHEKGQCVDKYEKIVLQE